MGMPELLGMLTGLAITAAVVYFLFFRKKIKIKLGNPDEEKKSEEKKT